MSFEAITMINKAEESAKLSRAQAIAAAFDRRGHRVVLGMAEDGNCTNPRVSGPEID